MPTRALVIFPEIAEIADIEAVRRRYDPLALQLPAHLTLVFPFDSDFSDTDLHAHIAGCVRDLGTLTLTLGEVTGHIGEYLFLNVKRGNDDLIALHDRLYTGPLAPHLSPAHTFTPHLTVGRLSDSAAFATALADARASLTGTYAAKAQAVTVYHIEPDGGRAVELRVTVS